MAEENSDSNLNIDNEVKIRRGLDVIQSMIDISADRLEGLRTQCATSAELTQQEIRTLETKLVKMFSELLLTKAKLPERLPSRGLLTAGTELRQWLRVVGLSSASLQAVIQKVNSLELLLDKSEDELEEILTNNINAHGEDRRRLIRAMNNLKRCRDQLHSSELKEPMDLYWDSWDRHPLHHRVSPRISRSQPRCGNIFMPAIHRINGIAQSPVDVVSLTTSSSDVLPEHLLHPRHIVAHEEGSTYTLTPSPSPPTSPSNVALAKQIKKGFPTTPPPKKKHQTHMRHMAMQQSSSHQQQILQNNNCINATNSNPANSNNEHVVSLTKSKSHESQFLPNQPLQLSESIINVNQQNIVNCNNITSSQHSQHYMGNNSVTMSAVRTRLHTEPSPDQHSNDSTENTISAFHNLSIPPKSPCTPIITRGMGHMIQHRFTKKFLVSKSTCDLCNKQMFFGFKCTECKYRCHKDCKTNVPPSCGLPQEFVDEFKKSLQSDTLMPNVSPNLGGRRMHTRDRNRVSIHGIHGGPDSSSAGSSCNSSSPSSPALLSLPLQTPIASKYTQFNFPEVCSLNHVIDHDGILIETHPIHNNVKQSTFSGELLSHSNRIPKLHLSKLPESNQSNDSDKTGSTSATSTDSSERTPIRLDSTEERENDNWPRQNSISLKEWDIPYDDLKLLEKIGNGRFGTVHRALWHGDVAVKLFKEDYVADERTLEAFKLEVATFKKTRHENVVLFMGACMKPPRLAIVTSLCKGNTLYTHIHIRKDKFNLNRTTIVAQQISQGMGYLHARGIVHKDLKTKNIFLENGKVIITDFGLFSATKLLYCDLGLGIPSGWLCYLAPELIRNLTPYRPVDVDLPFSKASDIFAFGTVWYELLCGEFPFKSQPSESVIWQVGRGMKQTLANLQASRDVKDILMISWSYLSDDRPDFPKLLGLLERLPKKRLARSPSHPVQLSRSAESVF